MNEPQTEDAKWVHGLNREDAHRAHDKSEEFHSYVNKAAIEAANLSLRTLVVINGGAAIASLTFLGRRCLKGKNRLCQSGFCGRHAQVVRLWRGPRCRGNGTVLSHKLCVGRYCLFNGEKVGTSVCFRWSKHQGVATHKSCVSCLRDDRCIRLTSSLLGWDVRRQRRHYTPIEASELVRFAI